MPYTVVLHFHTRVRPRFGCLFGQIPVFSTFFGINLALLSQSKASTSPFVPRAGFLEPCSCVFKTFYQTFLASVSTSARNQEKHQKKQGGASSPRYFSTSRPDRNTRVGPLAPSVVALAVHQKPCLWDVSTRNGNRK